MSDSMVVYPAFVVLFWWSYELIYNTLSVELESSASSSEMPGHECVTEFVPIVEWIVRWFALLKNWNDFGAFTVIGRVFLCKAEIKDDSNKGKSCARKISKHRSEYCLALVFFVLEWPALIWYRKNVIGFGSMRLRQLVIVNAAIGNETGLNCFP